MQKEDVHAKPLPTTTTRLGQLTVTRIGTKRFDWSDPYHVALSLSWPSFLGAVFVYYISVNLVFGALYYAFPGSVANLAAGDFINAFFFSVETFATVGYGAMAPHSLMGHILSTTQILVGLLSTAVITGVLFVRLARPNARFVFADKAVVCRFDGIPTLMIRVAHGRSNLIQDVTARATYVCEYISPEGISTYANQELKLVRDRIPVFGLSWTLMHVIDEASPLWGFDFEADAQAQIGARIMIMVSGTDDTLTAPVFALHHYTADQIQLGHQFVDMMERVGNKISMNLNNLSQTRPQTEGKMAKT